MLHHARVLLATILWVTAVLLMIEASIEGEWSLRGWATLSAIAAFVPTIWIIIDHAASRVCRTIELQMREERLRTEELVLAVACEFAQAEVPRLESRRTVN